MSDLVMPYLGEFVAGLGGVALAGALLKMWFDRRLGHTLDRELEKFRVELLKDVDEHRIKKEVQQVERNRAHQRILEFLDKATIAMNRFSHQLTHFGNFDVTDAKDLLIGLSAAQQTIRREEINLDPSIPAVFEDLFGDDVLSLGIIFSGGYEDAAQSKLFELSKDFDERRSRMLQALRETL